MSKIVSSSFYNNKNLIYFECECGEELMILNQLSTNEIVIDCTTNNGENADILIADYKSANTLYKKLCELKSNEIKSFCTKFTNYNDELYLQVSYDDCNDLYYFQVSKSKNADEYCWLILLCGNSFIEFTAELKQMLNKMLIDECVIKPGMRVKVKSMDDMKPESIDSIGRLHFNLGDNTDIVFNPIDMGKYCELECIVDVVHTYVDNNNQLRASFYLKNEKFTDIWLYTFTIDMVDII